MNYLIPFLLAAVLSAIFTKLTISFSTRKKLLFIPRNRDVHKKPVSRIGGIAMLFAFLLTTLVAIGFNHDIFNFHSQIVFGIDKKFLGIFIGAAIISITMLVDDVRGLPAWLKLIVQLLCALIVIGSGVGIDFITNPFGGDLNLNSIYIPLFTANGITYHFSLWSDILTLIWMIGMMNVINFIDGVDGLAGGISGIAAFALFLLSITAVVNQPATAMLSIIVAGVCLGFLVWNFPPAKIFMGDSGAMFLGFMLGALPLISGGKLATAFLVLGFPIVDGLFVAGGRILKGQNPLTTPDKTHLHHRFLSAGFSTRQSILILYTIAIAFAWVALRSTTMNKLIAAGVLVVVLIGIIQALRIKAKKFKI